jgi:hypothetical protein
MDLHADVPGSLRTVIRRVMMKKAPIVIAMLFAFDANADVCPAGFSENQKFVFVANSDPCPSGYSETSDYLFIEGNACPSGYSDASEYVIQSNTGYFYDAKGAYQYTCTGAP